VSRLRRVLARSYLSSHCDRCDLLVGLKGFHVLEVAERHGHLGMVVDSTPVTMGCSACGVLAVGHGRRAVVLVDVRTSVGPSSWWRKRAGRCIE
jgi:transposase